MRRVIERLDVYIHGDRLHTERTVEMVYRERMEREFGFQGIDIPEPKNTRTGTMRPVQNVADPSPNAPLLKRVVKHPFSMDRVDFQKSDIPRVKIDVQKKIEFPRFIQEQLKEQSTRIEPFRPMELHIPVEVPRLPSIEDWMRTRRDL